MEVWSDSYWGLFLWLEKEEGRQRANSQPAVEVVKGVRESWRRFVSPVKENLKKEAFRIGSTNKGSLELARDTEVNPPVRSRNRETRERGRGEGVSAMLRGS
jgi:hypothetical protein